MESPTPIAAESVSASGRASGTALLADGHVPVDAIDPTAVQFLNVTAVWEFALVVAAVLIIAALVGARAADAMSHREFELPVLPSLTADDDDDDGTTHTYEEYISPDTPDELLSDKGQIIRILVENDGRTYQYQIVEETGWSKSKVSRLLSEMHEDGEIGKVSVGRENAIVLADHGPGAPTDEGDDEHPVEVKQSL